MVRKLESVKKFIWMSATYRFFLPPFWITISAFGCCRLFTWEQTNDIIRSIWRRVEFLSKPWASRGLCARKSNTCILYPFHIKLEFWPKWGSLNVLHSVTINTEAPVCMERPQNGFVHWAILFEMPQKIWAAILGEAYNLYSKLFSLFTRFGSSLCNEFLSSRVSRNIFHVGGGGGGSSRLRRFFS